MSWYLFLSAVEMFKFNKLIFAAGSVAFIVGGYLRVSLRFIIFHEMVENVKK